MNKLIIGILIKLTFIIFALGIVFWIFVISRIIFILENHVGFDITAFNVLFVIAIGGALLSALITKRIYFIFIAAFFSLSLYGIHIIDRDNYLVKYDIWLKRGMPEKGRVSQGRLNVNVIS
jgi:hypothetical protein